MASLIPGFEYDIFISYRQKDNKHEGWVTEFVEHLKGELEATFKEDISIYFDENPHDGLLETHDVDESLKEKLKCLVFIPVISRTYCDPRSFAWEHEFKAFIEQASGDRFGLKIRLPNGNVSSRVLPVRIHDLDIADVRLCESMLKGVMRGVDFVYKEPGVNRPLTREDDEEKNLNRTRYKNQINKTANAIKEIIAGLVTSHPGLKNEGELINPMEGVIREPVRRKLHFHVPVLFKKLKKWQVLLIPFILLAFVYLIYKVIIDKNEASLLSKTVKSIAVIPFTDLSTNPKSPLTADAITWEIISQLYKIKDFDVKSWPMVLPYKGTAMQPRIIGRGLKVNFLIYGSLQTFENQTIIKVQLINARSGGFLWDGDFKSKPGDSDYLTGNISKQIASQLRILLTPEEIEQIDKKPSANPDALRNFMSANLLSSNAYLYGAFGRKLVDSTSYNSAITEYDNAIKYDSLFALAYARRAIAAAWGYYLKQVDSTSIKRCKEDIDKALALDKDLKDTQIALGFYNYHCLGDYKNALVYFNNAAVKDTKDFQPLFYMAMVYRRMGEWEKSQDLISRVKGFNPQEALFLTNIGLSYTYLHEYDSALKYHQKAIDVMPMWSAPYLNKIETLILMGVRVEEAGILLDSAIKRTGEELKETKIKLSIYEGNYINSLKETEKSVDSDFGINGNKYLYIGKIHNALNNKHISFLYYDSARIKLGIELMKNPGNAKIYGLLGIAYAGLGLKEKALDAVEKAIALSVKNKMDESDMKIKLAEIYTMNDDYLDAFRTIDYLLYNPSCFSVKLLQLDPVWKPLTGQPEFKTILKNNSKN